MSRIRGRYEPLEVVGRGGQGQVLRAWDHQHDRHVALKVRTVRSAPERDALLHEARILLDLEPNPNLPLVRDDFFEDDGYYIVMEWIEGTNLQELLGDRGPLPLEDVTSYLEQVAAALDHLHSHDPPLVHRDVKPANIVVDEQGRAVLVDFGIAARVTDSAGRYGTGGFQAPEVSAGADPSPSADIFGLAATAFALLSGGPPAAGERRRWLAIVESQPKRVEIALRRGLAADPTRRPASASELVSSIRSEPTVPNNLPVPLTSFVGREREIAELWGLLQDARLVTLTGTGGIGKTRLALRVAAEALRERPDGAWIVELAALSDAGHLARTVASALGVREIPTQSIEEALAGHLATRDLLLVLDNCERLTEPCAELAISLLKGCRNLRIMATSREALGAPGERLWPLGPLALPREDAALDALAATDAVSLFVDRALHVRPAFELSASNAAAVVEICRRVEGIPLAIELAAAEVRMLPPEQIAERLEDRLRGETTGSPGAGRHATMRAAVDWSYDRLSASERALYGRLSVFAGGFTLDTAEAVCASYGLKVFDVLSGLADRSLVVAEERGGRARYRMLETVRQHAREALAASGDGSRTRARHLDWFASMAEEAQPHFQGPELATWAGLLDAERDNIRAALEWGTGGGDSLSALRLVAAVWHLWWSQGSWREGRAWIEAALAACADAPARVRARALLGAGSLAFELGEIAVARSRYEETLALARGAGDHATVLFALNNLAGIARAEGDYRQSRERFEEALGAARVAGDRLAVVRCLLNMGALDSEFGHFRSARDALEDGVRAARELDSPFLVAAALHHQGSVAVDMGDYEPAEPLLRECVKLSRELGDKRIFVSALNNLGSVRQNRGDLSEARALLEECRDVAEEIGDRMMLASALHNLGVVARLSDDEGSARTVLEQALAAWRELENHRGAAQTLNELGTLAWKAGDLAVAESCHLEALDLATELDYSPAIARCLEGLAAISADSERAARLFGAAEALRESAAMLVAPAERGWYASAVGAARSGYDPAAFDAAWAGGRAVSLEDAVAMARGGDGIEDPS